MQTTHQFNGQEPFDAPREKIWEVLTDVHNVPQLLPNLKDAQFPSADLLSGKLASSFSFLHGELNLAIQITDRERPTAAKMTVTVRGIGCRAVIHGSIDLPPSPTGPALLRWQAEAQLEGLLAAISKGLIEGAARSLVASTFEKIRTLMAPPSPGAPLSADP